MDFSDQILKDLGVYEYTPDMLSVFYNDIYKEIERGTVKTTSKKLPGLIDTGINIISRDEWAKVPDGQALVCAFAGTNWIIALMTKREGVSDVKNLISKNMESHRGIYTTHEFSQLMADEIYDAVKNNNVDISKINAIGIALGFSQDNIVVKNGIEARFNMHSDSKGWHFDDSKSLLQGQNRPFLGEELIKSLSKKTNDWKVRHFAFRNDTHCVAEDGQTFDKEVLPIGFVFGTGDNAVLNSINLEIGRYPMKVDRIITRMTKLNLLPTDDIISEYFMGGDYLRYRVFAALDIIGEMGVDLVGSKTPQTILESKNKAIISDLAKGDETPVLKVLSKLVLTQAGQLMGINIAATVKATGYVAGKEAGIPIEGSVFWEGEGVLESAKKTVDYLLPGNKLEFIKAIGIRGIGKVALWYSSIK